MAMVVIGELSTSYTFFADVLFPTPSTLESDVLPGTPF